MRSLDSLRSLGIITALASYYYHRRHKKKSAGLGGLIAGFFFLLIFGAAIIGGVKFLPLFLAGQLNGLERINVAVSGQKTAVVSVSASGKDAVLILFPPDLQALNVAHGYGQYRFSKIFEVGELDHRGGDTLKLTMEDYLGIPIEAFVKNSRPLSGANLKSFFLSLAFILNDKSDLNIIDRITWAKLLSSVRFDRIKVIDLGKYSEPLVMSDGSIVPTIEKDRIDSLISDSFVEGKISSENLRIGVVNATDVAGLGNSAARVVSHLGGLVISVDNGEVGKNKCQVQSTEKLENSYSVWRIRKTFGCDFAKVRATGKADVVVEIGKNYADLMLK